MAGGLWVTADVDVRAGDLQTREDKRRLKARQHGTARLDWIRDHRRGARQRKKNDPQVDWPAAPEIISAPYGRRNQRNSAVSATDWQSSPLWHRSAERVTTVQVSVTPRMFRSR